MCLAIGECFETSLFSKVSVYVFLGNKPPKHIGHQEGAIKPKVDDQYMSSKQWLETHGLDQNNLSIFKFLKSSVFNHCEGVLEKPERDFFNGRQVRITYFNSFWMLFLSVNLKAIWAGNSPSVGGWIVWLPII